MKEVAMTLAAALLLSLAVPVRSAEEKATTEKDLCLLYSQNCAGRVGSIQEKIGRLQAEIQKGTAVYSPQELDRLEQKLKEAEELLDELLYSPGRPSGGKHR